MRSPVLRHVERKAPMVRSPGDPELIRAVSDHVERHIGPIAFVLHDLTSDVIHLDMLWVRPGPRRKFHTVVTCGMSERAMKAPDDWAGCRHAELLLRLPPSWEMGPENLNDPARNWPLRELQDLARLPHLYETFLWGRHTVANGDPPQPLLGSAGFSGSILVDASWAPRPFDSMRVGSRRWIHFFGVIPLYPEELLLARAEGSEALLDRLDGAGVTDLLDAGRPSVVGKPN